MTPTTLTTDPSTYGEVVNLFELQGNVTLVLFLVLLVVKGFAFVNSVLYPTQAYPAASRGTKAAWTIGLGIGLVAHLLLGVLIVNLAFTVAALVYILDTRPALAEVTSPR
ncbi:DUF2516 domain-containing protein [Nocardioides currus]|uniref:DUF2516 domain-containing protein n=1 Tax=Nocardioides currus TaxID=2133958 RepID=A0A2R7YYN8_9ACTN|nr:DUF2516 domain-containing protein [Nocardioides currus]